jgi:hypothetical protein
MEKIPTAEEVIDKMVKFASVNDTINCTVYSLSQVMIEFAKLHVEAALKAASEKAKITERKKVIDNTGGYVRIPTIYKKHILNAYSLENIK